MLILSMSPSSELVDVGEEDSDATVRDRGPASRLQDAHEPLGAVEAVRHREQDAGWRPRRGGLCRRVEQALAGVEQWPAAHLVLSEVAHPGKRRL